MSNQNGHSCHHKGFSGNGMLENVAGMKSPFTVDDRIDVKSKFLLIPHLESKKHFLR